MSGTSSPATHHHPGIVRGAAALTYAGFCYLAFQASFLAFVVFLAGLIPPPVRITGSPAWAVLIDIGLVLAFAVQHSVMARPWFKRVWTRVVPEPVERSTYVLAASIMLGALALLWHPVPGVVWRVDNPVGAGAIWGVFAFGWATVLYTTCLIDHFELFGLRQAWSYATDRAAPASTLRTPSVYRFVRHPMQLGFVIAFWAAPIMTVDRMAVALLLTVYICVALIFEERDLVAHFGDEYRRYQAKVPRLLPRPWMRPRG